MVQSLTKFFNSECDVLSFISLCADYSILNRLHHIFMFSCSFPSTVFHSVFIRRLSLQRKMQRHRQKRSNTALLEESRPELTKEVALAELQVGCNFYSIFIRDEMLPKGVYVLYPSMSMGALIVLSYLYFCVFQLLASNSLKGATINYERVLCLLRATYQDRCQHHVDPLPNYFLVEETVSLYFISALI